MRCRVGEAFFLGKQKDQSEHKDQEDRFARKKDRAFCTREGVPDNEKAPTA